MDIAKVMEKKEFSKLPRQVVARALEISKGDVKGARALLRKYFGVFLTNKILKVKYLDEGILERHISSKGRDYDVLYGKIFEKIGDAGCVVDLGCGVNGFSYKFLSKSVNYVGIEAVGQLVDLTNRYFQDRGLEQARVFHRDLFDLKFVKDILKKLAGVKPRVVFLFQVIDSLESFEKDFSKKFLKEISGECEFIVL